MGEVLWHGYDRDGLDDQYRASGKRIPNPGAYKDKWVADGETLRGAASASIAVGCVGALSPLRLGTPEAERRLAALIDLTTEHDVP